MASDDLFGTWLPAIWTKDRPEGRPPIFVIRRFLASERDLAEAAHYLQKHLRDPDVEFRVWQGLLPRARTAPRLAYPAPKKPEAETALVGQIMAVEALSRTDAEDAVGLLKLMGQIPEACLYYGVEETKA